MPRDSSLPTPILVWVAREEEDDCLRRYKYTGSQAPQRLVGSLQSPSQVLSLAVLGLSTGGAGGTRARDSGIQGRHLRCRYLTIVGDNGLELTK